MKPPQTPEEIRQTMTRPDEVCAAEYAAIHELITGGLPDVWDERENDDDARTYAISVCEEFIAHAQSIIHRLSAEPPARQQPTFKVFIREPGTIATLVAAARMGLDYLKRTNPLEHGNPDLGRTWGALEDALAPFSKDTLPPPPSVIHVAPFNG